MSVITIPKRLIKCPLVDALLEIRFESTLDKSVIFGYIYSLIRESYPGRVLDLPINQIPAQIRDNDPNLKYKPLYRIEGDNTIIQIGSDVICLSSRIPYIGWDVLSYKAITIYSLLRDRGVINKVVRLGHRYVNFFDGNIDDKLNMSLKFSNEYHIVNNQIRTEILNDNFVSTLQYSNSAVYQPENSPIQRKGSVIDIDTFRTYGDAYFLSNIESEINNAHSIEKNLFYSLLKEDFIKDFSPEY